MQNMDQAASNRNVGGFGVIGITEKGQTVETVLIEEITHRINNDLASTIAFIELTAAHSDNEEVKVALAGVVQHVHEFANVQRALRMPGGNHTIDASEYLRQLCQAISRAKLQYRDIRLLFRETTTKLGAQSCWRMGMIVSELIANSARHAFEGNGGSILVELASRAGCIECTVTDSGRASGNASPGHGSKIVQELAGDLNGRLDHVFGPQGTAVTLSFPLEEILPTPLRRPAIDAHVTP